MKEKLYTLKLTAKELKEVAYQAKDVLRYMGETGEIDDGTYKLLVAKCKAAKKNRGRRK